MPITSVLIYSADKKPNQRILSKIVGTSILLDAGVYQTEPRFKSRTKNRVGTSTVRSKIMHRTRVNTKEPNNH
jgi:uncharacterized membrane protein affecting hemolysin expression